MPGDRSSSLRSETHPFGFLARPEGGPHPGVVAIPDVWGLSDEYRRQAARLAGEGFAVLAIDPYRRTGRGDFKDPPSALAWIRSLSDPVMLETVQDGIDALAAAPSAARGIGVMGFCMGGQYALLAGASCRGLSACAPFYGMVRYDAGLDPARKPSAPLDAVRAIRCPVLGFYGAEDPIIPLDDVDALRTSLAASGQPYDIRVYAGAGHAFMNESRPEMYRPAAAADAWPRLIAFLRERLA